MMTHHAVLLSTAEPLLYAGEELAAVPAHRQIRIPQFGIGDVRTLIETAHRKPTEGDVLQTLLIATEFITEEAQQALLKIIEEPPASTAFIFVLPQGYALLPTLESRFMRKESHLADTSAAAIFLEFRQASIAERMNLVEQSIKTKNQVWQATIKRGLTGYLLSNRKELTPIVLGELEYVLRLLLTRGASNKFLLEHLALSLPLKKD